MKSREEIFDCANKAFKALSETNGYAVAIMTNSSHKMILKLSKDIAKHSIRYQDLLNESLLDLEKYPNTKERVEHFKSLFNETKALANTCKNVGKDYQSIEKALVRIINWSKI